MSEPGITQSHGELPADYRRAQPGEVPEALLLHEHGVHSVLPLDTLPGSVPQVWVPVPSGDVLETRGEWVQLRVCPSCATYWPAVVTDLEVRCPSCRQPYRPDETVSGAMAELRWLLDRYQHEQADGERDQIRATAVALRDCAWLVSPLLLRELERLYGNQVVARTRAIERGDAPQPLESPDGEQAARVRDSVSPEGHEGRAGE